jgi:hypothetical protein
MSDSGMGPQPRQLTSQPHGHMLTNMGVWSPDSRWIVYDTRSVADGSCFDGSRNERVEVATGRIEVLYESQRGACCGVVTASQVDDGVVFILRPDDPTADWSYGPARRPRRIAGRGMTARQTCGDGATFIRGRRVPQARSDATVTFRGRTK